MSPIVIAACGVLSPDDPSLTAKPTPADGDPYEDFPDDDGNNVQDPKVALSIAKEIKEIGSQFFREKKVGPALEKYQSISL
jgi:peptidyl-prolyl isomerase D